MTMRRSTVQPTRIAQRSPGQPTALTVRRVAKWTPGVKRAFCELIARGASLTKAAQELNVSRQSSYYQRGIDPEFAVAWKEALEQQADLYEDALRKAALSQGNIGGIIFALKNLRSDKWKDKHEIVQRRVTVNVTIPASTEAELLAMVQKRIAQGQRLLPPGPDTKLNDTAPDDN